MPEQDERDELQRRFIEENIETISALARIGYEREGRGAVFVFEDNILAALLGDAVSVPMEYVADGSDALRKRGGWPSPMHAELIREYDPDGSMVVLVGRRYGDRNLFTHHVRFPEQGPDLVSISRSSRN